MRKIFKTYFTIAITTGCLMLALSGTTARANGQLGSGLRTDPTPVTADCNGQMGTGSRCETTATATTTGGMGYGSGNRTDTDDSGGTIGSGHILAVLGDFFISLLG
jgi:hypothetical protein